jgi:hypothetical protein
VRRDGIVAFARQIKFMRKQVENTTSGEEAILHALRGEYKKVLSLHLLPTMAVGKGYKYSKPPRSIRERIHGLVI